MLTGDINPTSGTAYISGHKVPKDMNKARLLIGYCPQKNTLFDKLTAREHLNLFATIKGIPSKHRKAIVDDKIKKMQLTEYDKANRCAGTFSGGNKRKL